VEPRAIFNEIAEVTKINEPRIRAGIANRKSEAITSTYDIAIDSFIRIYRLSQEVHKATIMTPRMRRKTK
jgi:hypothetical protein